MSSIWYCSLLTPSRSWLMFSQTFLWYYLLLKYLERLSFLEEFVFFLWFSDAAWNYSRDISSQRLLCLSALVFQHEKSLSLLCCFIKVFNWLKANKPSMIRTTDWCKDSPLKDSGHLSPFQNLFCIAQLQKYSQTFLQIDYLFVCEKDALIFVNKNMYLLDLMFFQSL